MATRSRLFLALALLATPVLSDAQRPGPGRAGQPPARVQLERRLRERLREVTQQQLGLDEAQVDRLAEVNLRFEARRRVLLQEEVSLRLSMRRELAPGVAANDSLVADLLARSLRLQRQRITLIEEEQAELSQFLTPSQRARYFGLQEQLRRRIEELRQPPGRARPFAPPRQRF